MLTFRVLEVPKGLGAGPHHRGRVWALKHEVLGLWKVACIRMHAPRTRMRP